MPLSVNPEIVDPMRTIKGAVARPGLFAVGIAVELFKLYQASQVDAFRHTSAGTLLIGRIFLIAAAIDTPNSLMYAYFTSCRIGVFRGEFCMRSFTVLGLSLLAASSFACGSAAQATLFDVQFAGNFSYTCPQGGNTCSNAQQTGAAYIGSTGDQWNYFNSANGSAGLSTTAGAASNVSISFSAGSAYTDGTSTNKFAGTSYANLMGGYINSSGTMAITLSGLLAGQAFDLYTYTAQDSQTTSGRVMDVTVNGITQRDTQTGAGTFVYGANYLKFSGVADSSGKIVMNINTVNGESDLNGLQLLTSSNVPEPATWAMLVCGFGAIGGLMRRQRTTSSVSDATTR